MSYLGSLKWERHLMLSVSYSRFQDMPAVHKEAHRSEKMLPLENKTEYEVQTWRTVLRRQESLSLDPKREIQLGFKFPKNNIWL